MALSRGRSSDLPADAVVLTPQQALSYQWRIITEWKDRKDVWALRYAAGILGACSAVSSIYVNNHYRVRLKLGSYGRLSSYLPIVVIPSMFSMLAHKYFVQRPLILDPLDECPLCLQLRAAAFQTGIGAAYPTLLAPLAGFMFATRHFTYQLPSITQNPKEVLQLWRRFTKPIVPLLGAMAAGQALVAMYLTYKSTEQMLRLQLEMKTLEDDAERDLEQAKREALL